MNPGIESSIWLALRSRIESLPLPFARAWPGVTFLLSPGLRPYLRVGRVSATPVRLMIDNNQPHERTGAVIITLVHPLDQPTVSVYDQYASEIAAWFAEGTTMRWGAICVTVSSYPHVQEGYEDSGFWNVPVSISWRCFA